MANVDFELLAQGVVTAIRVTRIDAARLGETGERGTVDITATAKVELFDGTSKCVSEVTLSVTGYAGESKSPAFTILVTVQAEFNWPENINTALLQEEHAVKQLARAPYSICASEARQMAHKIGVGNVRMPPDFFTVLAREVAENELAALKKAKAKPKPKAKVARKRS